MVNRLRVALFFGVVIALIHFAWSVLVAAGAAQVCLNWVLNLHMISMPVTIKAFDAVTALELVAFTFVVGFVGGYVLAALWNGIVGKKK